MQISSRSINFCRASHNLEHVIISTFFMDNNLRHFSRVCESSKLLLLQIIKNAHYLCFQVNC